MKSSFRFGMLSTLSLILLLAFGNMTPSVAGAAPTYRSFLGRAGASTVVVAAASVGLPSLLSENAEGQMRNRLAATGLFKFGSTRLLDNAMYEQVFSGRSYEQQADECRS